MSETIKTRSGRVFKLPAPEEDARLTAAAMSDPDTPLLTDEEFERIKHRIQRGRPRSAQPKEGVFLRLSPEIAATFRATGYGWQARMNAALADWLKTHSP
ncbi:hypothetical protein AGMMS49960_00620 [Betaproteobacteria bacterium]|nr:hypothetical protein AGMMS49543_07040 [Betaproteobacteria bacterium]GHT98136.1 hypothetical protein AGMMS49960_00620 [Betaproteobacteria bacterium]GHU08695.1 hypothetical protein AGMMS50225_07820 [Betaproteobacteria bacterium]GHU26703.1 hypothetical protein FACS189488_14880 [Betaproteobacteria bacterium]